jgi:hypothetical protein
MSALRDAAEDYLVMRRTLGFKLTARGRAGPASSPRADDRDLREGRP